MFTGIKVKLLKNGKIQKVRLLSVLQDFEDRLEALEGDGDGESGGSSSNSSQSSSTEPVTAPVEVSFTVTANGNPVNNATVTIGTNAENPTTIGTGTTGSQGGCTIKDIPTGSYKVRATANPSGEAELSSAWTSVEISKTNTHFDITLA